MDKASLPLKTGPRSMHTLSGVVYTLLVVSAPALAQYQLVKDYSGQNFFTGWDYADGFDNTTNGMSNEFSTRDLTHADTAFARCRELAEPERGHYGQPHVDQQRGPRGHQG